MPTIAQEKATAPGINRRSRRTRIALRDALAAEIQATGDLSQVTVTAVTDRADVTRRTFYSHYRDIPDLVRCIEDEALDEMRPYVARISETTLDQLKVALDKFQPCPGSTEFLTYFKKNGAYLAALLGDGGDPGFSKRLSEIRWLSTGMREPVGIVARMMTAMLFVRPGDLYGRPIGFDIPSIAPQFVSQRKELLNGSDN